MKFVGNIASDSEVVATADGAITAGKPVVVNSDGTVKFAGSVSVSNTEAVATAFAEVRSGHDAASGISVICDTNENKFLISFDDNDNSQYGTAIVTTIDPSDFSLTYGTPVIFHSASCNGVAAVFDSSNNKVIQLFNDSASNDGQVKVGTISGTSISYGSAVEFTGSTNVRNEFACYDSTNNRIVIAYIGDYGGTNYGTAIVGTVSGDSISFGTAVVFESASISNPMPVHDVNANKIVIQYTDVANSYYGTGIVGTVDSSDNSISFGSASVYNSSTEYAIRDPVYDSTNNKTVFIYQDYGDTERGKARVVTVSGTSLSYGTEVTWETGKVNPLSATFDSNIGKVAIGYYDETATNMRHITGTVSGTDITFGSELDITGDQAQPPRGAAAFDPNTGKVLYVARNVADNDRPYSAVVQVGGTSTTIPLTSENFIGFAKDNVADGAVATIQTANSIARDNIGEPQSITYNNQSFSTASQDTLPEEVRFKPDGTKFYILGGSNDAVYQYAMSTAWDVSTASYESKSLSVQTQEGNPQAMAISSDGSKFYVGGQTDAIYQYNLSTPYDVSTGSYASKSFSTASQISGVPWGVDINDDGDKMYVIGNGGNVFQYTLSTPFDASTASYASKTLDTTSETTDTTSLALSSNGISLYVLSNGDDKIYKYTLSTAFDLATASYSGINFTTTSQENVPYGVAVKTDETQLYVTGTQNDSVIQYSLSTSLTIGQTYFVQTDGTLSTSADDPSVIAGTAISSTDLIVKG